MKRERDPAVVVDVDPEGDDVLAELVLARAESVFVELLDEWGLDLDALLQPRIVDLVAAELIAVRPQHEREVLRIADPLLTAVIVMKHDTAHRLLRRVLRPDYFQLHL